MVLGYCKILCSLSSIYKHRGCENRGPNQFLRLAQKDRNVWPSHRCLKKDVWQEWENVWCSREWMYQILSASPQKNNTPPPAGYHHYNPFFLHCLTWYLPVGHGHL